MKLRMFLGDHLVSIALYITAFASILLLLSLFRVHFLLLGIIAGTGLFFGCGILFYEFFRRHHYYHQLFLTLDQLDQKYLIHELVPPPSFLDGKICHQVVYEADKAMNEKILSYQEAMEEFKDFIELWVHEVKLPIAAGQLILHNNPGTVNKKLREQFQRVEDDVEQVLYYARSENSEKDYLIKRCSLDELVQNVIRRNKDALLYGGVAIQFETSRTCVYTDSKWMEFIINQIMNNAIQYCQKGEGKIHIWVEEESAITKLKIADNGVGIAEAELPRVFEKSFTGSNGRMQKASTGMGLYLCEQLCNKLGHRITLTSQLGKGTVVSIAFQKDSFFQVLDDTKKGKMDDGSIES